MKRLIITLILLAASAPLGAQWLRYPTPGLPRTPDGKPNLTAPASPNGRRKARPVWPLAAERFGVFIQYLRRPEGRDAAMGGSRVRRAQRPLREGRPFGTLSTPPGPRAGLFGQEPVKFVQTPGLLLVCSMRTHPPVRSSWTDGNFRRIPILPGWGTPWPVGRATRSSSTARGSTTGPGWI